MEAEYLNNLFSVYDYLSDGVLVCKLVDDKLNILYANQAVLSIFEYDSLDDMRNRTQNDLGVLVHPEDKERVHQRMGYLSRESIKKKHHLQYRIFTANHKVRHIDDHGHTVNIPPIGDVIIDSITHVDDSVIYSYEFNDSLTGLLNIGPFTNACRDLLTESYKSDSSIKYNLVYLNIRNFKSYNVEHGKQAGDQILRFLANRIHHYSSSHVVSRIGSDHFVAITKASDMENRIEHLIEDFEIRYQSFGLSLKVGVYQIHDCNEDLSAASDFAKTACDSIHNSNIQIAYYNNELKRKLEINNYVITHLEEAIEKNYLKVYYQPVVRTINNTVCGMEALVRWIDPVQGFLSPGEFIPALEDNLFITKLDLYVLHSVCKDLVARQESGQTVVPISFNLSRLDFITCDIFAEVESVIKSYRLPRDLIRVEVTESAMMDNPDAINDVVQKFRSHGYEVWMDDFGSGYSSLNLLKDFEFDEIKLDMLFMRDFNDRSKNIVRSMVSMAKKLGIKTLAEGVETPEQYQFLKEIGCERVQGYYFSAPKPYDQLLEILSQKQIQLEERYWARYYDRVGQVDVMKDKALAIIEYDGENYKYLFTNSVFENVLATTKDYTLETSVQLLNSPLSVLGRNLRALQRKLQLGDPIRTVVYPRDGQYYRASIRLISELEGYCIDYVELINITNNEAEEERNQLDKVNRKLYEAFDAIYIREVDTGKIKEVVKNPYYESGDFDGSYHDGVLDLDKLVLDHIHKDDQKAFLEFMNPNNKLERIKNSRRGYLAGYFRTKEMNGSYTWKAHVEQYIPEDNILIYSISYAPILQNGLMERAASDYINNAKQDNALWYSLMQSKVLNLFWKDKQRRFIGVNDKFLDTYGITDMNQLIGKTDEDMHWHIENEPFRSDEWDVIEHGITIENRSGKCLIKGVLHNIVASKEPIYRNGEIVGLLGYFINVDDLTENLDSVSQITYTDSVTKLLSAQGLVNTVASYIETWKSQGDKFAIANVSYGFYEQLSRTYGDNITRKIIEELGKVYQTELVKLLKYHVAGARIYADTFIFIATYEQMSEIEELMHYIMKRSDEIHELAGVPITLNPTVEIHYCENHTSEEMMAYATNTGELTNQEMHGALLVYRADESEEILYASSGLLKLFECNSLNQFKNLTNNSFSGMVYPDDLQRVESEIQTQIASSTDMLIDYVEYRIQTAQGNIFEVKDYGHLIETPIYGKAFYVILTKK